MDGLTLLVGELRRACAAARDPELREDLDFILAHTAALGPRRSVPPRDNPAERQYLDPALEAARGGPLAAMADAIGQVRHDLPWQYTYGAKFDKGGLSQRIAFAELMGSRGPLPSDAINIGLTLIAPDTFYPAHRHPAIELYFVISGEGLWTRGEETRPRRPGDFVLHGGNVVHAMQSRDQPLLALYSWRGDLASPSVYL